MIDARRSALARWLMALLLTASFAGVACEGEGRVDVEGGEEENGGGDGDGDGGIEAEIEGGDEEEN